LDYLLGVSVGASRLLGGVINLDAFANLQAWFQPEDWTTATGVNLWNESVSGNDVVQATGSLQPAVVSNWQNGLDAIQGDGTDDLLGPNAFASAGTSASFTVAIVGQPTANDEPFMGTSTNGFSITSLQAAEEIALGSTARSFTVGDAITYGTPFIGVFGRTTDSLWGFVNGVDVTPLTPDSTSQSLIWDRLCADLSGPFGNPIIGEVAVWNTDHRSSAVDISDILNSRWAIY
jgi:hypothetical protein